MDIKQLRAMEEEAAIEVQVARMGLTLEAEALCRFYADDPRLQHLREYVRREAEARKILTERRNALTAEVMKGSKAIQESAAAASEGGADVH